MKLCRIHNLGKETKRRAYAGVIYELAPQGEEGDHIVAPEPVGALFKANFSDIEVEEDIGEIPADAMGKRLKVATVENPKIFTAGIAGRVVTFDEGINEYPYDDVVLMRKVCPWEIKILKIVEFTQGEAIVEVLNKESETIEESEEEPVTPAEGLGPDLIPLGKLFKKFRYKGAKKAMIPDFCEYVGLGPDASMTESAFKEAFDTFMKPEPANEESE